MSYLILFSIKTWKISDLIKLENAGHLDLKPHYQRNAIWSAAAQRSLISTIKTGYPLPSIFVRDTGGEKYEIVDGQQRCRAILSYNLGDLADSEKVIMRSGGSAKGVIADAQWKNAFGAYPLLVTIIDKSVSDKDVEDFYVTVNSTGIKLNSAELRKAEYYDTRFLSLANRIADSEGFQQLDLFTEKSAGRMNDIDFISELLTFLMHGHTDKKIKVADVYESDIASTEVDALYAKAIGVISKINKLNSGVPLRRTRFKQKNDFYTLFAFIEGNPSLSDNCIDYVYHTLLRLSPHISPSQENCEPLREYALNCVSQSNSKKAREARSGFFKELFGNEGDIPTETQKIILGYLNAKSNSLIKKWGRLLIDNAVLQAS